MSFAWNYAIPVTVFVYCYGRIFHKIRRQSKVIGGHVGRSQEVTMATTSRDPNTGQVQQQAARATTAGTKLSRQVRDVIGHVIIQLAMCDFL